MAQKKTTKKSGSGNGHKAYWQQPWVQRVLQGNYSSFEKLLFMRIASFGPGGCWMKNKTLMAEFRRSESTIQQAITRLCEGNEFWITGWDSTSRMIYAHHNPEVIAMAEEMYRAEIKAGTVKDKDDFYVKNKTRRYKTQSEMTGSDQNNPVESHGVKPLTP